MGMAALLTPSASPPDGAGFPVGVGSGLSQAERINYAADPTLIVGKTVRIGCLRWF
jgi:hypothetical protein